MALYKFTYLLNCKIAVILMLCDYVCVCVWSLYVAALLFRNQCRNQCSWCAELLKLNKFQTTTVSCRRQNVQVSSSRDRNIYDVVVNLQARSPFSAWLSCLEWPWATLSHLVKNSVTQSITRSVCDSWASCRYTVKQMMQILQYIVNCIMWYTNYGKK